MDYEYSPLIPLEHQFPSNQKLQFRLCHKGQYFGLHGLYERCMKMSHRSNESLLDQFPYTLIVIQVQIHHAVQKRQGQISTDRHNLSL